MVQNQWKKNICYKWLWKLWGVDFFHGENKGLLEAMGLIGDDVIGHMTAGDVIVAIKVILDSKDEDK